MMLCAFPGYAARSFIALQVQKRRAGVISGQTCRLPTSCAALRWAGVKATCRGDLRPAAPSADRLRLSAMGRGKSDAPGCAPACGGIWRRAAASYNGQEQKQPAGGDLRPDVPSTDKLRRPTMGRSKSGLPGCAPACGSVYRQAAAPSTDRLRRPTMGAKATRRGALGPDVPSADALRRPTMGRSKSHLPGCAPACGTVYRRVAAAYDGQGQKPPAGACSGLRQRLPTGCGVLRWAGVKATCRGVLRPAAASGDALQRPTMGRGKSHLPGCSSCLRHSLPTRCGVLRWAGVKATCRGDLRPAAASTDKLRRPTMGRGKSGLPG